MRDDNERDADVADTAVDSRAEGAASAPAEDAGADKSTADESDSSAGTPEGGEAGTEKVAGEDADTAEVEPEKASYEIIGLVDIFDEQGNITGQYPVGSVQELTVEAGDKAVEEGRARKVE